MRILPCRLCRSSVSRRRSKPPVRASRWRSSRPWPIAGNCGRPTRRRRCSVLSTSARSPSRSANCSTPSLRTITTCGRSSTPVIVVVKRLSIASRTCWTALAWGAIGALNPEVTSRSIILPLVRALPEESKKLLHTAPERDPLFNDARREFGAWARAQTAWPDPVLPNWLHGRLADNWRPLFAATEIIGGDWPSKIREAAEFLQSNRPQASEQVKLLACIKRAFGKETSHEAFISTGDLVKKTS